MARHPGGETVKISIHRLDTLFAQVIKQRDQWTCQRCGKKFVPGHAQGLDTSHIFGRRHKSVRWQPLNAKSLCFTCHRWWHENPTESGKWAEAFLGREKYACLVALKNEIVKDNVAHRKSQWDRLKALT
mgnify:FL=1